LGGLRAYTRGPVAAVRVVVVLLLFGFLASACTVPHVKPVKPGRAKGVYHLVRAGETLSSIARAYHVDMQDLAEANNIENPNLIEANRVIFIPDADQVIDGVMALTSVRKTEDSEKTTRVAEPAVKSADMQKKEAPVLPPEEGEVLERPLTDTQPASTTIRIHPRKDIDRPRAEGEIPVGAGPSAGSKDTPQKAPSREAETVHAPVAKEDQATLSRMPPKPDIERAPEQKANAEAGKREPESLRFDRKRFIWPVQGRVVSRFGIQPNGMYYNGITIAARAGMPVVAAADGTIIFSGPLKDYGETVIMKHEDGYATVYTHLGQRKVKLDDHLKKGVQIGMTGPTQKTGDAGMVFEIRYKNKARNPMFFLP
jgi:lipoprotein NlpD